MVRSGPSVGLIYFLAFALAASTALNLGPSYGRELAAPAVATRTLLGQGSGADLAVPGQPTLAVPGEFAAEGWLPGVARSDAASVSAARIWPRRDAGLTILFLPPHLASTARMAPADDSIQLPILMYHHLRVLPVKANATWKLLTVTPAAFEQRMAYLTQHGYHTIYFSDLVTHFDQGRALPPNPIILTFDDGWLDDYTVAYPILRKYGMTGAFFPPTNWVGKSKLTVTWQQIEEMDRGGMEFGSHTVSHRLLTPLDRTQVLQELQFSKSILDGHLQRPVVALAYPGGALNGETMKLAAEAGYGVAVGVRPSAWQKSAERYTLRRMTVPYGMSLARFAAMLAPTGGPVGSSSPALSGR